jgi:hypothetical protein
MIAFFDLAIGGAFRIRTAAGYFSGLYFKTGPESYGLRPDAADYSASDLGDWSIEQLENVIGLPSPGIDEPPWPARGLKEAA